MLVLVLAAAAAPGHVPSEDSVLSPTFSLSQLLLRIGRPRLDLLTNISGSESDRIAAAVWDVLLWRRGRADVSACLLAGTVSSWLLLYGGYTLVSLASNVLLLLLTVLFLWAKAARLLNRPQPPVPELRVPQQAVDEAAALLRSALDAASDAFRDIALGRDSLLFYRAFLCLWSVSIVGSVTDFPTACYASVVAALTIPALYHRHQECIATYMSFAYMNLRMYEMAYERLSMKCFVKVRDWTMELLKDP